MILLKPQHDTALSSIRMTFSGVFLESDTVVYQGLIVVNCQAL